MVEVEVTSRIALVNALLLVGSAAALLWIGWRLVVRGQVLDYEPRRRVPWMWGGILPALLMTSIGMLTVLTTSNVGGGDDGTTQQFISGVFSLCAMNLALSVAIVAILVLVSRATLHDLGWPTTFGQFWRDIGIGIVLAVAALIPIYVLQYTAIQLLGIDASHPLLDRIASDPNPMLFFAIGFAAIIVAPIFEELVYRLLLQGSLERREDELVDWPYSRRPLKSEVVLTDIAGDAAPHLVAPGGDHLVDHEQVDNDVPYASQASGAVTGLRHGWGPILASSFLFALAHLGNGPSPIALFVFGLFLGYAYQRTHRILPSIVAHLVFNAISIAVLFVAVWR